jgi:hypothetical protein
LLFSLSYRDVEELLAERGVLVNATTPERFVVSLLSQSGIFTWNHALRRDALRLLPHGGSWLKFLDYFFTPNTPSFAALATRNLTTILAGILIFYCVFGLMPVRAFLFCFRSLPKPGKTNSPVFLISL